jgi:hypothetical protein
MYYCAYSVLACLEVSSALGALNLGSKELVTVGIWYIWWERRWFVRGKQVFQAGSACCSGHPSIQSVVANHGQGKEDGKGDEQSKVPAFGNVKLNVDVGFDLGTRRLTVGAVVWDERGHLCCCSKLDKWSGGRCSKLLYSPIGWI